jgi:hypothetical protein
MIGLRHGTLEVLKVLCVRFASPQVHIGDFKVVQIVDCSGSLMIQALSAVVGEEFHCIAICDVLRILLDELRDRIPERRDRLHVFQHRERGTWIPCRLNFAKAFGGRRIELTYCTF